MGKLFTVAAAIVLLTASGVGAGNFELLADSGAAQPVTPLFMKPGTVVKAEFKSSMRTSSDTELDADTLTPEPVAAAAPQVRTKPAVAFRERPKRGMAPPPAAIQSADSRLDTMAQARDGASDLEGDLEKDLVLSPPRPKAEEAEETEAKPKVTKTPAPEEKAVTEKKGDKKRKAAQQVKKVAPPSILYTAQGKPIQKVKPVSANPWSLAAGSHQPRAGAVRPQVRMGAPRCEPSCYDRPATPQYMASEPRQSVPRPPAADRFVRDGVTVKLAPAAAAPPYPSEDPYEERSGSDLLSTATEIIGLPFALISSLF